MKPLTLLLILILLLPYSIRSQTKDRPLPKKLFGIALGSDAANLLAQVENKFNKPVREGTYIDPEPSNWADSQIDSDGAPVVRMNSTTRPSEAIIVHELFHLKLKAEGYPWSFSFMMPPAINTDDNAEALKLPVRHLYATIEHWIFYPEMWKMKINPNVELSAEFEQARKKPTFFKTERPSRQGGALYYVKAALQFNDPKRVKKVVNWYKKGNWKESLELGQQLTQQVILTNPHTPEGAAITFVDCLNLLYEGVVRFSFEGWKTQRKGEVDLKIAVIQIIPAKT